MTKEQMRLAFKELHKENISYKPVHAKIMGSVAGGVILSQILYWWSKMDKETFYKNDKSLREETCASERELREAKRKLKSLPFLTITVSGIPATTHYTLDWEEYLKAISDAAKTMKPSSDKGVPSSSYDGVPTGPHDVVRTITETTQEITTKNIKKRNFLKKPNNENNDVELSVIADQAKKEGLAPWRIDEALQKMKEKGIANPNYLLAVLKGEWGKQKNIEKEALLALTKRKKEQQAWHKKREEYARERDDAQAKGYGVGTLTRMIATAKRKEY